MDMWVVYLRPLTLLIAPDMMIQENYSGAQLAKRKVGISHKLQNTAESKRDDKHTTPSGRFQVIVSGDPN